MKYLNNYDKIAVASYPFEIHESGWGEFEILIKIYFKDDFKQTIEIFHNLKVLIFFMRSINQSSIYF